MSSIKKEEIKEFIELNIKEFHDNRLKNLLGLKLNSILKRKNPYLFKAKNQITSHDLVKAVLDAFLSSQEEGIFGGFLEKLAIFINGKVYGGKKSSSDGIDLEFERDGTNYLVAIKSGPNWGNSRQIAKMKDDFRKAKKILGTNTTGLKVVAVNGCCYGKNKNPDKGDYLKLCGQAFWEFVSGETDLYIDIIEPLGHRAKEKNEKFYKEYSKVVNKFTRSFSIEYCSEDGSIMWNKLVKFNSGKNSINKTKGEKNEQKNC